MTCVSDLQWPRQAHVMFPVLGLLNALLCVLLVPHSGLETITMQNNFLDDANRSRRNKLGVVYILK